MSDLADVVQYINDGRLFMIVDVEYCKGNSFMFHLFDLRKEKIEKWFEPFEQQLRPTYWETLA